VNRSRLALFVVILVLLPAPAGAAVKGSGFAVNIAFAPGSTVLGSATGATGETAGDATGASASPSPSGTSSPLTGAGIVVLGLLLGVFLLLRTRLLRRRS